MSAKETVRRQYARIADQAATQIASLRRPPEGWLTAFRKALGMSGAEVAERMSVSRNAVYQAERNEREGAITINQMRKVAEAMGGRFVYAVIPEGNVTEVLRAQAIHKAEARVGLASTHMALEQQALTADQSEKRIEGLADELVRTMPTDFWKIP